MTVTPTTLSRAAGVAAVLSGSLYITIQFIHPPETVAAVSTPAWAVVAFLTVAVGVFGLIGVTGVHLRQVREAGVLGLIGYSLFSLFLFTVAVFSFVEALVLPAVATEAPAVVDDILGIFGGAPADGSLGALEQVGTFAFLVYLTGGVTFGLAILRARVLPRWAGVLLAAGAAATPALPLLPPAVGRFAAVPVGLALVWLGVALWVKGRTPAAHPDAAASRAAAVAE